MASKRSLGGGIKIPSGGGAIPNYGGGNNALMTMMMAQSMLPKKESIKNEADIQKQTQLQQAAVPQAKQVVEQFGGQAPVGWKYDQGGVSGELTRKYSPEESTSLSGADSIENHLNYIRNAADFDPNFKNNFTSATFRIGSGEKGQVAGIPLTIGNKDAIKLAFHINEMNNRLIYLRSGKQINEYEYQRLSRTLPSYTDISDPNDTSYSALKEKLGVFENEMKSIKNRLIQGGVYDSNLWGDTKTSTPTQNQSPIPGQAQSQDDESRKERLRQRFLKK